MKFYLFSFCFLLTLSAFCQTSPQKLEASEQHKRYINLLGDEELWDKFEIELSDSLEAIYHQSFTNSDFAQEWCFKRDSDSAWSSLQYFVQLDNDKEIEGVGEHPFYHLGGEPV
ncbi:MAG: hypothetical protein AAF740_06830 [Bacteroidota bacterium]